MGFSVRAHWKPVRRLTRLRLTAVDVAATTTSPFVNVAQNRDSYDPLLLNTDKTLDEKIGLEIASSEFPSLKFSIDRVLRKPSFIHGL
jgi:hypothetical protein